MTALHQYQRLEAAGLWRDGEGAQRREVIIGLREATIILIDPKTEMPLTQWSLPAIVRLGEVAGFVTFASAEDGLETLEIDDPAMIAAFDKLRRVVDQRRRRPGRLRGALIASLALGVLAGGVLWMPLYLTRFTIDRLPQAARAAIGASALAELQKTTGSACDAHMGQIAAESLARRIDPLHPPHILILRDGLTHPTALPGGLILLPYDMVTNAEGPDVLAGLVLAEMLRAKAHDPMVGILHHAGFLATIRLLSSGALPDQALAGLGPAWADLPRTAPEGQALQNAFAAAKITALPYLETPEGRTMPQFSDPAPNGSDPVVLDDPDFLGLQYICGT